MSAGQIPFPWQEEWWRRLLGRYTEDRLAHALLISGRTGLGKRDFAKRLAQTLLCGAKQTTSCDRCRSCRLFLAGAHPDFVEIGPEQPDKPIVVKQIRGLTQFLGHTSQLGGMQIGMIDSAQRMNLNAANSLLKTLEEPADNSLIMLVCERLSQLPATVVSRCLKIIFAVPQRRLALAWLERQAGLGGAQAQEELNLLMDLAAGAPLRALEMLAADTRARRTTFFHSYLEMVKGKCSATQTAEQWHEHNVEELIGWQLSWQMDIIRLKMGVDSKESLANADFTSSLNEIAQGRTAARLFQQLDASLSAQKALRTQINKRLLLEELFIECCGR